MDRSIMYQVEADPQDRIVFNYSWAEFGHLSPTMWDKFNGRLVNPIMIEVWSGVGVVVRNDLRRITNGI